VDGQIQYQKESGVGMKISVIDSNKRGVETMIQALGICRNNECTADTLERVLVAKPVPHMSVLEFGWVCLLVEGVSVKTRIQLLRNRLFSTMERSTRSIDMSMAIAIIPDTVKDKPYFRHSMEDNELDIYQMAIDRGETLEDASYLLPLGVETSFFLAGNLRVFFEYFQKRLCKKHVQDEHYRMAAEMWNVISGVFPIVRKAHPCQACGDCHFRHEGRGCPECGARVTAGTCQHCLSCSWSACQ
jgi:thymidylate synthase ThyX